MADAALSEGRRTMDAQLARDIAVEAYIYLFPLVLMDVTRRQMTNVERVGQAPGRGPADAFTHVRAFPPGDFRDVVRPNFDTLYSIAWLDLHDEPRIVSVPPPGENYYLLPMYDMWSEIFACPGSRTTGGAAGEYALCGPDWEGELRLGVERIDAPTRWVWLIGRTQASPTTYEQVHAFQDGMRTTPLSAWPGEAPAVRGSVDESVDEQTPPKRQAFAMSAEDYFAAGAELLREHPPHFNDGPVLQRLARIGLNVGRSFDLAAADAVVHEALTDAVADAQQRLSGYPARLGVEAHGWRILGEGMGTWGTSYLRRAGVALIGLGANLPEDSIYALAYVDGNGEPLTGEHDYVVRFPADGLPPAEAFWSLTLYDADGFQVANDLDRFAIGDRDALRYDDDGSLSLRVRHSRPESGSANWLPAPEGGFNLCLRLYSPRPEALDGRWTPGPVTRTDGRRPTPPEDGHR